MPPPDTVDPARPGPEPATRRPLPRPAPGRYAAFVPQGQGGMGIVYRVLDTFLAREVAFKVARPDPGGEGSQITPPAPLHLRPLTGGGSTAAFEEARARFVSEACLTGGIEHPSVPPVYDVGETEGGLPYYTMRFIPGNRTLADAIDEAKGAGLEERLRLLEPFLKVCDALSYAHSRGVVHRDVKPHNVALGEFGEVVVLDWGLAAPLGAHGASDEEWQRRIQDRRTSLGLETSATAMGTPGWMAPETLVDTGKRVDERGDVFALGVVLHQVLTGRLPWPCRGLEDYARAVADGEARPARDVDPSVPAALSEIAVQALRRDPAERTGAAAEVARAVRAWQAHRAFEREREVLLADARTAIADAEALAPEASLRLLDRASSACETLLRRKEGDAAAGELLARIGALRARALALREQAARRHALRRAGAWVLGAAVVAAVAVAFLLDARRREAEQARHEADAARLLAQAERSRGEDTMKFMLFDLLERLEPLGRLDLVEAVAGRAKRHYEGLVGGATTPEEDLGRAVALRSVGEVFEARGDLSQALESFRAASAVSKRAADSPSPSTAVRLEATLDRAKAGAVRDAQGYRAEGMAAAREHLERVEALAAEAPRETAVLVELARARLRVARSLVRQNDVKGALVPARLARTVADELLARSPGDAAAADLAIEVRLDESQYLAWADETPTAIEVAREALGRARALASKDPEDRRWSRRVADADIRLIVPLGQSRDLEGAREAFRDAQAIFERETAADPSDERWSERMAISHVRMADVLIRADRRDEALDLLRPALAQAERLSARDPSSGYRLHLVVDLSDRVSGVLAAMGKWEDALAPRARNVEASEALVARDPQNPVWRLILGFNSKRLGETRDRLRDFAAARDAFVRATTFLVPMTREFPDDSEIWLHAGLGLLSEGRDRARLGDPEGGRERMRAALSLLEDGVRRLPASDLPFHLAQSHVVYAGHLDPAVPAEREEALRHLEPARAWLASPAGLASTYAAALKKTVEGLETKLR